MAWSRYAFYHFALMAAVYATTLFSFASFWSVLGCRPLLFLPILFMAQITQTMTPWLILWAGLSWDSIAFWPLGLSCAFYFIGSFTWPFWQRWAVSSYMIWGVFGVWATIMHAGPWMYLSFIRGVLFPWEVMIDVAITVCCFPLCAYLWPFGRNH